ncbi:hypothetical protein [Pseudomonas sp.]|uniref:hypothetical protein n=1 Tax=Pseudomonas sp. TaxID=306 RepID=UPI0025858C0D|nr:hypothetical protein [Pseudomonas sp.]
MKVTAKNGNQFEVVGEEPYTRQDGTQTTLKVWRSHCVDCNQEFTIRTTMAIVDDSGTKQFMRKRCDEHKNQTMYRRS